MGANKRAAWVGGTILLALLLMAAAWFVLIGPTVDATAQAHADTAATEQQNQVQRTRLQTLAAQFAELDEYKAELAAILAQIPAEDGQPAMERELQAQADAAGLVLTGVSFGLPVPFATAEPVPVAPAEPPADAEADEAEEPEGEATAESEPEPTTTDPVSAVGVAGFYAVPVQVTVIGAKEEAWAFISGSQERLSRLFTVTGWFFERQDEQESQNGKPATIEGEVEVTIDGYVYVLVPEATAAPDADTTAEDAEATN